MFFLSLTSIVDGGPTLYQLWVDAGSYCYGLVIIITFHMKAQSHLYYNYR